MSIRFTIDCICYLYKQSNEMDHNKNSDSFIEIPWNDYIFLEH